MGYFKAVELNSGERFVYTYTNVSQQELEKAIHQAMTSNNYSHLGGGIYEKGSRTKRILLGALHNYYKFQVSLDASNQDEIRVGVKNNISNFFISGGLIGMNNTKTELLFLSRLFEKI